jgi:AcrR family transcriptional regulator
MDKQIDPSGEEGAEQNRPLGVRAANKARTRQRLIDAARKLFMERGYEGATVRDIAGSADLSTGAVFASFADKTELFNAVLQADGEAQLATMNSGIARPGPVAERLVRVLSAAYQYQLGQIELLRAALAVSWSQGLSGELGDRPIRGAVMQIIRDVLGQGAAKGEIRPDCDLDMLTDTIWDCFIGNYRHALFNGQGANALTERARRQIDLIMKGAGQVG